MNSGRLISLLPCYTFLFRFRETVPAIPRAIAEHQQMHEVGMVFDVLHLGILLFLIAGGMFAAGPLIVAYLVAPNAKGGDLGMPYECGMRPHGSAWSHFGINYYAYALLFIAFDVDVLYLFPVAAYYHMDDAWVTLVKLLGFLFFLVLALVYFRAKGVFTWPRKIAL